MFLSGFKNKMNSPWEKWQREYKNSVLMLTVFKTNYKINEPYKSPTISQSRGSAFFITKDGYCLTNFHVISGAISVSGKTEKTGSEFLDMTIIASCPPKDVALLKLNDLSKIGDITPIKLGNDALLKHTASVMAIGFPLGKDRIKFTTGIVSGYENPIQSGPTRNMSYIQTDLAINPGSSGGCLLNDQGEAVGINAAGFILLQNISYSIPTRVVLSILRELFKMETSETMIVIPPELGIETQKMTDSHYQIEGISQMIGLRIKEISPISSIDGIIEGDIITKLSFPDPYSLKNSFDVETYRKPCDHCKMKKDMEMKITRYGDAKLYKNKKPTSLERKLSIQEVIDVIPSGTEIGITVFRKGERFDGSFVFENGGRLGIDYVYLPFETINYVIFGGIVFVPLMSYILDQKIEVNSYLGEFIPEKRRGTPRIIISQIFPSSEAQGLEAINKYDIVSSINGKLIYTIDDVEAAIFLNKKYILIKLRTDIEVVLAFDNALSIDKMIHRSFGFNPNKFSLKLWKL